MKHFKLPIPQTIILICYVLITGLLIAYKYSHFLYTQLDLAIFANALRQPWDNLLYSTLQGHHYFGDHFMPYLVILKPVFDLFKQSSIFLLSLQVLMITGAAWPMQKLLNITIEKKYHTLFFALCFLNPLAINIALYEFHPELLYIPLILWAVYFFTVKNYKGYIGILIAILLMREDSLLAILPFTLLALMERRNWKWWVAPLLSIPYLFLALQVINYFNPAGHSLFLRFYAWMGGSLSEIIINSITQPWLIIQHLSTIYVFEFVLGGLMLFIFLPLFAPRYLLIGLFSYLSLALGLGQDVGIYHSHYSAVIFPSLVCAAIFGLQKILKKYNQLALDHKVILAPIVIIVLAYFHTTNLSPFPTLLKQLNDTAFQSRVVVQREALNHVNLNLPTVASYQFLDRVKSPEVYFIGYAVQQLQQFQIAPYHLPKTTTQSILDLNDLFIFGVKADFQQYQNYEGEFVQIIKDFPVQYQNNGIIVGRLNSPETAASHVELQESSSVSEGLKNIKYSLTGNVLIIKGTIQIPEDFNDSLFIKIESMDNSGEVQDISYHNFGQGQYVTTRLISGSEQKFALETSVPSHTTSFKISSVNIKGAYILNPLGTSQLTVDVEKEISSIIIK